jgi:glycosyltransferase involved in cell wall biosynthesis
MRTRTAFLMPVYNPDPARLRLTLDSLRAQTVAADIVLVDDGSSPPVEALLDDGAITLLRLPRNAGIVAALNHGLRYLLESGYEYIARMDCGDLCLPNRIAAQQEVMDRSHDLDLLGSRAEIVDEAGQHLFVEGVSGDRACVRRKLWDNAAFKHPTFFLRARSVARLGLYSPRYTHAEDYEFMRRYAERGHVACLDDVLLVYEKTAAGLCGRNRGAQLRSRLRAQLRYFDPRAARAYLGVARTIVTMLVPGRLWSAASRLYWRAREGRAAASWPAAAP